MITSNPAVDPCCVLLFGLAFRRGTMSPRACAGGGADDHRRRGRPAVHVHRRPRRRGSVTSGRAARASRPAGRRAAPPRGCSSSPWPSSSTALVAAGSASASRCVCPPTTLSPAPGPVRRRRRRVRRRPTGPAAVPRGRRHGEHHLGRGGVDRLPLPGPARLAPRRRAPRRRPRLDGSVAWLGDQRSVLEVVRIAASLTAAAAAGRLGHHLARRAAAGAAPPRRSPSPCSPGRSTYLLATAWLGGATLALRHGVPSRRRCSPRCTASC